MSETIAEKVAYYRAKHREWQQMGPGDRYEQHDAIGVLFRALDEAQERAERAERALKGVVYQAILAPSDASFCAKLAREALNTETTNG